MMSSPVITATNNSSLEFIFVAYRNDFLFPSRKAANNSLAVEGVILSATIKGENVNTSSLAEPVIIETDIETTEEAIMMAEQSRVSLRKTMSHFKMDLKSQFLYFICQFALSR